jgi:hypothetical protein
MKPMTSRLCPNGFRALILFLLVFAAACGYDEGKDLPAVVDRATPAGAELVGECTGSSGLIESPSHECAYLVPGDADEVTAAVAEALADQGFAVSCRGNETTIEIAGLRGNVRVRAQVTADGSVTHDGGGVVNVYDPGYVPPRAQPIPADSVALSLGASRQREASDGFQREWIAGGFPCTEDVLKDQTLEGCVAAWNGPHNGAKRRHVLRRMRVPVAYVYLRSNGPGVSSGCFFGFLAHAGRYLIFKSSWREGRLVFAKPELGYSSAKGLDANARVRPNGRLRLKPPSLNERCEVWWNAEAGAEARAAAVRRRLTAEVEAVYEEGQAPRCTYTLRSKGRYLEVVVELRDSRWATTPLRPVEPTRLFRPNGEVLDTGWLTVGP